MIHDPDLADHLRVSAGDVTVEETFVADEFPVPAIKFVLESTSA
ncbi:hypothetical protein SAMN04487948_10650 [Halogranum amylolyticum]|uniref:Uncharacterized protein n=1 Tax=Halogranum amylolyticum TaxID=660520 RepID=A0A1H8T807_9EURY|nr:hypothetical protein [Halogranum amylolyticum]SEO86638.1 hypothetical protein SAMN04487948_10650 [Halogranum amylolyticum]